jgi:hypothetical protein
MVFPSPDFYSNKSNKREGGGEFVVIPYFYVATNFTELKNILFLNRYKNKFELIDKEW